MVGCDRDRSVASTGVATDGSQLVCVGPSRYPPDVQCQMVGFALENRARVYTRRPNYAFRLQTSYKFTPRIQLYAASPTWRFSAQ